MKAPENKENWIVDEKVAAVVKRIFNMCMNGMRPFQIANTLTQEGIDIPAFFRITKSLDKMSRSEKYMNKM